MKNQNLFIVTLCAAISVAAPNGFAQEAEATVKKSLADGDVPANAGETGGVPAGDADPVTPVQETIVEGTDKETNCTDKVDNDNDSLIDCADADCYGRPECAPSGGPEISDALCSDFIDNDNDGYKDCDDIDCQGSTVSVCNGSMDRIKAMQTKSIGQNTVTGDDIPQLGPGQTVEDLIGTGGDIDGERNDFLCSDGIDNDGDGKTDCEDFGCRFDPQVTICTGTPGIRFSMVAQAGLKLQLDRNYGGEIIGEDAFQGMGDIFGANAEPDAIFRALQLRAFGPLPGIQDSFFLISTRFEKTPRLTFAMVQFPVGGGHFFNMNSGGGGLSSALVRSNAKRAMITPPYYLYNSFEQGNGISVEFNGPLVPGKVGYRAFVAGGQGAVSFNVGGRFANLQDDNFAYGAGGQLIFTPIGHWSRWDSEYLYTKVPTTLGISLGARYDQRPRERFPAANLAATLRSNRLILTGEVYAKRELEFESTQLAFNAMVGALVVPKKFFIAADVGQFVASEMGNPPAVFPATLETVQNEFQYRFAGHWYIWKNIGILSLLLTDHYMGPRQDRPNADNFNRRSIELVGQYRF